MEELKGGGDDQVAGDGAGEPVARQRMAVRAGGGGRIR